MTIKDTILQIKKGSPMAERALFDWSCGTLKSVAMRYMGDHSSAEDVLQETYIRIFRKIRDFTYTSDAATMAWMKQITVTESLRLIKKNKRWSQETVIIKRDTSLREYPSFQDDLYKMLIHLSTQQRIVFNMHALEGYSHEEIAEHLHIAIGTSRSILSRARATLQQQLKKQESNARA